MKRKQSEVQDALARTSQQAEEVIGAMRTVQQFTREADEARRYCPNPRPLTMRLGGIAQTLDPLPLSNTRNAESSTLNPKP